MKVLAYTSPARGHAYPFAAILTELAQRGHAVAVRTLASEVPMMTSLGFAAGAIDPAIEAIRHDDWQAKNPRSALQRSVATLASRASHDAADLQSAVDADRPDVLIVDVNTWGAIAAAEASGLPYAVVCPYPLALSSPDVPPFGPGFAPARGLLGRARDRVTRPLLSGMIDRTLLPRVNEARSTLGLAALATADELFLRPPLVLYLTAEPFEYARRAWPANIAMVGPCAWEPPAPAPTWLDDVDKPLVLVTTSSEFQDDARLAQCAFDALRDEDVCVVATLPSSEAAELRVPSNGRAVSFVPHGAVLERAVCAVTHGGMGATQKALARGVPVCAVPFGRDQLEVARRVDVAEAGTRLSPGRMNPARLRAAVMAAVDRRPGAERVASGFAAAGGPASAAERVELLVRSRVR
ncbi:MAG: glycosyltransferase [Acidimicrobiia bacterium]